MDIKNDAIFEIEIIDMAEGGEGIGKIDGLAVFVDGGITGDKVRIKQTKKKKKYAIGRIIKLIEPSKWRVEPKCKHAFACGGCQVQHMDYAKQLEHKNDYVDACIERIAKIENFNVEPIIGMENPYHYRNKGQYPIGTDSDGNVEIGFYKTKTHHIVDVDECFIQNEKNNKIIKTIKDLIMKYRISVYEEKSHKGTLRHIMLRNSKANQWMVVFVTNGNDFKSANDIVNELVETHPEIISVIQNVNSVKGNRILGYTNKTLYGADKIVDTIGDLTFELSPLSFFQVNPIQTEVLYGKALEFAELTGEETVVDVYCGIGSISLFLAQKAKSVIGIEIIKDAILDAEENAKINNLNNTQFYTGDAEVVMPKLYKEGVRPDVVVIDPPRKGCEESVLKTIADMNPKRVVYVSCKPSTMARDLKILGDFGYKVSKVQPVDMFPHTLHVECVVKLSRITNE